MTKGLDQDLGKARGGASAEKKEGPLVAFVSTWKEAESKLRHGKAQLCVLDISENCLQLPRENEAHYAWSSRVILVCDSLDDIARKWLHRVLPGAMLLKPVSEEQLAVVAERLLATSRQQDAPSTGRSIAFVTQAMRMAEALFNDTPQGLIISDPEGRTVYANKALADMVGRRQEEIIGTKPEDLLDPKSMERFRQEYRCRRRGREFSTYQVTLKNRGRRPLPVVVTGVGVYSESGKFLGSFGKIVRRVSSLPAEDPPSLESSRLTRRSLRLLVDSLIPSLLGMKSLERLRAIVDFMEAFLELDGGEAGWWGVVFDRENPLTSTEIAMCAMIRSGLTSDQMAEIFGISRKTVAFHRGTLRRKLGLKGREERLATFLKTYAHSAVRMPGEAGDFESCRNLRLVEASPLGLSAVKNKKCAGESSA